MIRDEEARLRRVFRRLLLVTVVAPAGLVNACGDRTPARNAGSDAGLATPEAGDSEAVGAGDAEAEGAPDADVDAACAPGQSHFETVDAGDGGDGGRLSCYTFVDLPCGPTFPQTQCYLSLKNCYAVCGTLVFDCQYTETACIDGGLVSPAPAATTVACGLCSLVGRRPRGLRAGAWSRTSALGGYFARVSFFEAASVHAFALLRDDLTAHGAPRALVAMAARCARDEVRHAKVTAQLARRHGGRVPAARVRRARPRTLEAVARENAVEGCVRETFGAMVAAWQASRAADPRVRRAMVQIAKDETRHAALAWAIGRWADSKLSAAARERVARARTMAVRRLATEHRGSRAPEIVYAAAGLPRPGAARALVDAMARQVWAGGQEAPAGRDSRVV